MQHPAPTHSRKIHLAKREMLSLDPTVSQVVCESGCLWITQDRDTQDILLEPGQSFAPDPGRRAILYALGPATLRVHSADFAPATAHPRAAPPAMRQPLWE